MRGAVPKVPCVGDAGEPLHGLRFCSLHGCWGSLETDVTKLAGSCYCLRLDTVPESELGFLWKGADGASCRGGGSAHLVSGWDALRWVGKCSHESSADLWGDGGQRHASRRVYLCEMCSLSVSVSFAVGGCFQTSPHWSWLLHTFQFLPDFLW